MKGFPEFLVPAFDEAALAALESSIVAIDPKGEILWVNSAFERFADENGGDGSRRGSYYDGIDASLRDYFRNAFEEALQTGKVFEQDYECSSPEMHRCFRLRALPIRQDGLLLEHSLVSECAHAPPPSSDERHAERYVGPAGTIAQCSNCRRVRDSRSNAWHWAPSLVRRVDPRVSHVLCPSCVGFYWGARKRRARPR